MGRTVRSSTRHVIDNTSYFCHIPLKVLHDGLKERPLEKRINQYTDLHLLDRLVTPEHVKTINSSRLGNDRYLPGCRTLSVTVQIIDDNSKK